MQGVFEYKLSSHPASLFQATAKMRKANKPMLFKDLHSISTTDYSKSLGNNEIFALHGRKLLHKIKREQKTFAEICASYNWYMRKQFWGECRIVFDGYPIIPATKNQTQAEQTKGTCIVPKINFSTTSLLSISKAVFLRSKSKLLSTFLQIVFEKTKSTLFV